MASRGWHVAVAYLRNEAAAERVADDVRHVGRQVLLHRCNLTKVEECRGLIDRIRADVGTLRGLVHCAGLGAPAPVLETRPNRWRLAW
jgi:NAD(P)-dependent dehydrogenase (short-subunit alcohol dehydrogenase family)